MVSFAKIGSVCDVNPRLPKDTDLTQKVSFLSMSAVSEAGEILNQEERVLSETKKGFTYFERDDILLAKITPCFENGKAVLTSDLNHQVGYGSTEFHVLRAKPQISDGKYLFYLLWNDIFRFHGKHSMIGAAGQKRISADFIKNFKIPLPPLAEQQKIAAILDAADSLRQKDQQLIDHYTTLSQSLFLEMFGDPVTNPMEWRLSRIDSLCKIVRGSSPRPKGDPRYYGGNIPRLMVADLTRDGKSVTPKIDFLTEEGAKKSRPTQAGTVVMAVSGNVGLTSMLSVDACIHDGFIAFNDLDFRLIKPVFFVDLMMFLKATHASRQAGAIFKNLTTSQIKEMNIPLPPLDVQADYCEKISTIEAQKQQAQASLEKSNNLFNSLLQRAFKGELTSSKAA